MRNASEPLHPGRWIFFIHQIPPKPAYLRVKVWRQLQKLGAVPIKNSVYVLPAGDQAQEDFTWVLKQIAEEGGEAMICEARLLDGLTDPEVEDRFREARNEDYQRLGEDIRRLLDEAPVEEETWQARAESEAARFRRRFAEIQSVDFFHASAAEGVSDALARLDHRLLPPAPPAGASAAKLRREDYRGRVWVTRKGIHVDRMACAWLIQRFLDPEATLKFVPPKGYLPGAGEVRFDMFEAEFTHEGDLCSFEVLLQRFGLEDPALAAIGEIIHDIDLKDAKFQRPETAGVGSLVTGIARNHPRDEDRLTQASALLENLYASFRKTT